MDNKNIPHLEKILKRTIPYNRKIKLYTNYDGVNYFPIGASRFIEPRTIWNSEKLDVSFNGTLYPEQIQALNHIKKYNCGLIDLKTGGGKCYGKGEQVICFSGGKKNVEDIRIGDKLMGPDSTIRNVIATTKGFDMLYEIETIKGETMIVTGNHILVLRCSYNYKGLGGKTYKQGEVVKMTVLEYLDLFSKYKKAGHIFKLFKPDSIEFYERKVYIEPYMLGLWLGDGGKDGFNITNQDNEIIDYINEYALSIGQQVTVNKSKSCPTHCITKGYKGSPGLFCAKDLLREYDLINNKHIPKDYLFNSKNNRLQLLAGLIDSDGYLGKNKSLTFNNTNENIVDGIVFLCHSLGFAAYKKRRITKTQHGINCISWNVSISGNIENIPCRVKRRIATKREQQKNVRNHGFTIIKKGVGEYFGFELDGDRLHMNKDFFVCHNSFLLMGIIDYYKHSTLIIVPTTKLLVEMKDKIKEFMNYNCGLRYSGKKELKDITITTSKSYCENLFPGFDIIIVDEGDTNLSKTFLDKINLSNCNILIGLTGTPSRIELDVNDLQLIYGPIVSVGRYQEVPTDAIQYVYRRTHAEEIEYASDNFAESRNLMIQNQIRTQKIVEKILDFKTKYNIILILTDRVEECNIIAEHIPTAKIIHGKTKIKDDIVVIEEVKKEGGIIIGTRQKMGRGVDIPAIDCVCLVGAFKFKSAVIQAIGRALRKFPGKKDIGLYIFSDSNLRSQLYENKKTVETEYKIKVDRQFLN